MGRRFSLHIEFVATSFSIESHSVLPNAPVIGVAQADVPAQARDRSYLICAVLGCAALAAVCILDEWAVAFLILLMLLVVPPVLELRAGRFDLLGLQTLFSIGYFLNFVMSTLYSLYIAPRFLDLESFRSTLPYVLTVCSIGLLLFHIGFYSPLGKALAKVFPKVSDQWTSRGVIITTAVFLVVGVICFVEMMAQAGGFENFEANLYNVNELLLGNYYLNELARGLLLYAFFVSYLWARAKRRWIAEAASYVILTAILVAFAATGSSGTVVLLLLSSVFVVRYLSHWSRRDSAFIVAAALLFVFVMPIYRVYRNLQAMNLDAAELVSAAIEERNSAEFIPLIFRRFYGVESLTLIIDKVGKTTELRHPGDIFLSIPREFIPRGLWPEKPYGVGFQFIETFLPKEFGDRLVAGPPTLVGELYWNLFLPGVILGMFAVGVIARCGNDWFASNRGMFGLAVYFPLANLFFAINEGAVASRMANEMAPYLMAALIAELIMRLTKGTASLSTPA